MLLRCEKCRSEWAVAEEDYFGWHSCPQCNHRFVADRAPTSSAVDETSLGDMLFGGPSDENPNLDLDSLATDPYDALVSESLKEISDSSAFSHSALAQHPQADLSEKSNAHRSQPATHAGFGKPNLIGYIINAAITLSLTCLFVLGILRVAFDVPPPWTEEGQRRFSNLISQDGGGLFQLDGIRVTKLASSYYPTSSGPDVLVLFGELENIYTETYNNVMVKVTLIEPENKTVLKSERGFINQIYRADQLANYNQAPPNEGLRAAESGVLKPLERGKFMLVMTDPPKAPERLEHRVELLYAPEQKPSVQDTARPKGKEP